MPTERIYNYLEAWNWLTFVTSIVIPASRGYKSLEFTKLGTQRGQGTQPAAGWVQDGSDPLWRIYNTRFGIRIPSYDSTLTLDERLQYQLRSA